MTNKAGEDVAVAEPGRVNKKEFLSGVARRAGVPRKTAAAVYAAVVDELMAIVSRGDSLMLTNFGLFYRQEHKGHRVQFVGGHEGSVIGDYHVLKFSAAREVNRRIGGAAPAE